MEIYIHIPFCRKKCSYCAFISWPGIENQTGAYIRDILREAELRRSELDEPVRTVYIGGGTPSILRPYDLKNLVSGLDNLYCLKQVEEFSIEANPGTLNSMWLKEAVSAGINRISLGMQAYQPHLLKILGRIHSFDQVSEAVHMIKKSGISNINLDLIFGIPSQTISDWKETLYAALSLSPQHISAYGLIPEESTPLYNDLHAGRLILPDPEIEREMYELTLQILAQSGFIQYEISNFAQAGFECLHNIGYWEQVPYLGLGVSAASMIPVHDNTPGMTYIRRTNPLTINDYESDLIENSSDHAIIEYVTPMEARFESLMLFLRMTKGISESRFLIMHGVSLTDVYGEKLLELERQGFLQHESDSWRLTRLGMDFQNTVLVELME